MCEWFPTVLWLTVSGGAGCEIIGDRDHVGCVIPADPRSAGAMSARRQVVIDFWADACVGLKSETLEHPSVMAALQSVELTLVNLDKYSTPGDARGVATIPDLIFADGSGPWIDGRSSGHLWRF